MVPSSIGAVVRIAAVCLCLGTLLGLGVGWKFLAAPPDAPIVVEPASTEGEREEGNDQETNAEQQPPPPVDVELARLLSDSPGALLPSTIHQLTPTERLELSSISTIQSQELGIQLDIPFGLDARNRTHTAVQYEFANPDGHTLTATLIRWSRCRPRFDQLYHLRARIGGVSHEIRDPANHRLATYLLALRLVGLEEVRGRRPHHVYDIIYVGNGLGYLRSNSGPCAQCDTTAREFLLEWTEEVDGGYKDMTLSITSNYPGVDEELLIQMARTIRMDDSTILQCNRPAWPVEPEAVIRRIDELNLMDPGTETYRDEVAIGNGSSEPPESDEPSPSEPVDPSSDTPPLPSDEE